MSFITFSFFVYKTMFSEKNTIHKGFNSYIFPHNIKALYDTKIRTSIYLN